MSSRSPEGVSPPVADSVRGHWVERLAPVGCDIVCLRYAVPGLDDATLDAWLTNPRAFAAGNKMTFAGLSNPQDRADVIAYLKAAK